MSKKKPLFIKHAMAAHCPKCYRFQLVEKRHDHGKLRLSCGHKIRPKQVSELVDVTAPTGPAPLVKLHARTPRQSTLALAG